MSNSTNMVVHFDGKGSNLHLHLRSIFQPAKFEQTITHRHVLLRWESIDGGAVTIILCLP